MTIQGIAPCIFGEMFKDPTLVKQMTEAYIPAWDEIEVGFNKTVIVLELTTSGYYGMYLTALIIDCAIARLYRHNGATNKSVMEPGTTEWNQTCYRDYMWSMLNCNGEFLEKDCSSAEI